MIVDEINYICYIRIINQNFELGFSTEIINQIPFDKFTPTFEWCNEFGIVTVSSFVIGIPIFSGKSMRYLNVVQGYFFWDLLTKSDYDKKEKNVLHLFKQFKILLNRVSHINIRFLPEAVLTSAIPLFRFFFAAKFCKKTRKKYGLD